MTRTCTPTNIRKNPKDITISHIASVWFSHCKTWAMWSKAVLWSFRHKKYLLDDAMSHILINTHKYKNKPTRWPHFLKKGTKAVTRTATYKKVLICTISVYTWYLEIILSNILVQRVILKVTAFVLLLMAEHPSPLLSKTFLKTWHCGWKSMEHKNWVEWVTQNYGFFTKCLFMDEIK